ncbi:hypothetical protein MTR62_13510 [Novosphingobium sp. 1949]|uniref:Uncharacterized protein n=1 Tax=Novosphingobium organovorum TaxID=2930092 RepID=A0ABT0BF97_9SPHN|nr:hypothetical protein [Novosphingobium organovorum]MCJ2183699.1 hypothetical protein [Novosphingobium organovorum]
MRVVAGTVATGLLVALGFGFWWCRGILAADEWTQLVRLHMPAIAGVPFAAVMAFSVTLTARAIGGSGAVVSWGIRFGGMAVSALFWILTFLATTLAIRMLW